MLFADRVDAGRRPADRLKTFPRENLVVLGLPRGGVPVAFQVASALEVPLDIIVVRKLGVPLVRVGLPIHDRVGAQRTRHLGYRGAHDLFDRVTNALIEQRQDQSPVGYAYM